MKSAADNQGFSEDWPPKPDEWPHARMAGGRGREAWPRHAIPLVRPRPIRGFPVSALRETISHDLVPADSCREQPYRPTTWIAPVKRRSRHSSPWGAAGERFRHTATAFPSPPFPISFLHLLNYFHVQARNRSPSNASVKLASPFAIAIQPRLDARPTARGWLRQEVHNYLTFVRIRRKNGFVW